MLVDFYSAVPVPSSGSGISSDVAASTGPPLIPPDLATPDGFLVGAVAQPLSSSTRSLASATATIGLVLSQRFQVFHLPHRRALLGIRARVRLLRHYGLASTGIPLPSTATPAEAQVVVTLTGGASSTKGLQTAPIAAGGGRKGPSAAASTASKGGDVSANDTSGTTLSAIAELLLGNEANQGSSIDQAAVSSPSSEAIAPPALLKVLSLLSVPGHPGVPLAVQVRLTAVIALVMCVT